MSLVDEGRSVRPHQILVTSASGYCRFLHRSRRLNKLTIQTCQSSMSSNIQILVLFFLSNNLWRSRLWNFTGLRTIILVIYLPLISCLNACLIIIIFKYMVQICVVHVLNNGLIFGLSLRRYRVRELWLAGRRDVRRRVLCHLRVTIFEAICQLPVTLPHRFIG